MRVVLTGKFVHGKRCKIIEIANNNDINVTNTISKNTDLLVCANPALNTNKIKFANLHNIETIPEDMWLCNLPKHPPVQLCLF